MTNKIIILSLTLLLSAKIAAASSCTPETIQFYLDKGFSQEQVTKLCSQTKSAAPSYEPYQKPIIVYQEGGPRAGLSAEERRAISEIKGGVDGRSVDVTDTHISYIRGLCLQAGNTKNVDERAKKCIDVAYSIARKGLTVDSSGRGLLIFGQVELAVGSSEIIRKPVVANPYDAFPPDIRYQLQRKYESTQPDKNTTIPVRRGASPGLVVSALKTIAASTELEGTEYTSEVAKVLDDNYVPLTEEEYLASQPTPEEIEKEEKKKKKWWNPFD